MQRLFIVDGSNLLFQMYYGMPARITGCRGQAVHGTIGFCGALFKMLRALQPTHALVLFDGEHENPRCTLDPAYKANRVDYSAMPLEETPFSQLEDIYAALDYMSIRHTETCGSEADDVIAAYALKHSAAAEVIIASQDSDFFQLLSPSVSVLRYRGKNSLLCTPAYTLERYGIEPAMYADYKCLVGDAADNIRGAPSIGPKRAAALLNEFGTLEAIIANAQSIKQPAISRAISASAATLRINKRLIALNGAAPLPFTMDQLEFAQPQFTSHQALKALGIIF